MRYQEMSRTELLKRSCITTRGRCSAVSYQWTNTQHIAKPLFWTAIIQMNLSQPVALLPFCCLVTSLGTKVFHHVLFQCLWKDSGALSYIPTFLLHLHHKKDCSGCCFLEKNQKAYPLPDTSLKNVLSPSLFTPKLYIYIYIYIY